MTAAKKRTLISFDYAAKYLLRDKANFDILEGFLTTLLEQEIKVISILESEGAQESESDKFNKVDLVVETENKELIVVEIQNNREFHYFQRLLYGSSKLIVDHIKLGEDYVKIRKVISISILYFLLGVGLNDNKKLELKHHNREALVGNLAAINDNIFPEYYLLEVERFENIIQSGVDEWIYFFKNSEIREDFKSKNIQLVAEKLNILRMSQKERRVYERYLTNKAYERNLLKSAKIEGKIEGEKSKAVQTAQIMLVNNEPLKKIIQYTGLAEEEIQELKKN